MVNVAAIDSFSKAARRYDEFANVQLSCARSLLAMLPDDVGSGFAMDLGCGTLPLSRPLREAVPQCHWFAVDPAQGMLAEAVDRGRMEGYRAVQASAENLPFAQHQFQLVYSSFALQWAVGLVEAFNEIQRVLVPGGVALVALPLKGTLHELANSWATVNGQAHINAMPIMGTVTAAARQAKLIVEHQQQLTICEYYPTVKALSQQLKATGANVVEQRSQGLVSIKAYRAMEAAYETLRVAEGLPVTWEVGFYVLRKHH